MVWLALLVFAGCTGKASQLAAGDRFPALNIEDLTGQAVHLPPQATAEVRLLSIRTIGCRFCASDFAELEKLYHVYSRDKLDILVINVGVEGETVHNFLRNHQVSFPVFIDPKMESMKQTNTVIVPVAYLIGQDGTIVHRLEGGFSAEEIQEILTGLGLRN